MYILTCNLNIYTYIHPFVKSLRNHSTYTHKRLCNWKPHSLTIRPADTRGQPCPMKTKFRGKACSTGQA